MHEDISVHPSSELGTGTLNLPEALRSNRYKYVGFALLLSWHYCVWFVPRSFVNTPLLDDRVTYSWLINLVAFALSLFLIAGLLGKDRHLPASRHIVQVSSGALFAGTLMLCMWTVTMESAIPFFILTFALGIPEAILWTLWGELFTRIKSNYSIAHIGTTFGIVLFVSVGVAWLLPGILPPIFTSVLAVLSGVALSQARKSAPECYPPLLPQDKTREGEKNMTIVCVITFFAGLVCYYLAAIIPWEMLPMEEESFTVGILVGAVAMLVLAGFCLITGKHEKSSIFKLYPGLLLGEIFAFAMFLADEKLYLVVFLIAVAISSLFEVVLIMYFGIMTRRGYATPALAFAFSGGFIRSGIAAGNGLAILFEKNAETMTPWIPETCLVFICLLAALLIPLVRREYSILELTKPPASKEEVEVLCDQVSEEFKLSCRESEILFMLTRGYTASIIAEQLVISPHTVNTHIRHIYEKMQIHKRSELLSYMNVLRGENEKK